jgi:hypothetical protein
MKRELSKFLSDTLGGFPLAVRSEQTLDGHELSVERVEVSFPLELSLHAESGAILAQPAGGVLDTGFQTPLAQLRLVAERSGT